MVHDIFQHSTGQTVWSHKYGHNKFPFNDKADALAKQAAATHPLQPRYYVLRRPTEWLASSEAHNAQPQRLAASVVARVQQKLPEQATQSAKCIRLMVEKGVNDPAVGGLASKQMYYECC